MEKTITKSVRIVSKGAENLKKCLDTLGQKRLESLRRLVVQELLGSNRDVPDDEAEQLFIVGMDVGVIDQNTVKFDGITYVWLRENGWVDQEDPNR